MYALRDIIPPATRASIANGASAVADTTRTVISYGGSTLWIIASSALLLGVPWALAWSEELGYIEMEKEMKMREMGGEVGSPCPAPFASKGG